MIDETGTIVLIQKIFISEVIKEFIEVSSVGETAPNVVSHVRREVDNCIFSNTIYDSAAFLLLFISVRDLIDFKKIVVQKNIKYFYYKIILISINESPDLTLLLEIPNVHIFRDKPVSGREYAFIVKNIFRALHFEYADAIKEKEKIEELTDIRNDQHDLIEIGKALSVEKDQDKLLGLILFFSQKITGADAGSIFLIEELETGERQLRFKYANTYSLDISYKESVMPLNKDSIAGYVAITGKTLNIPDVYKLTVEDPVLFNSYFDKTNNYRTKSMLVVPMRDYSNEIIGVIQLLNSKEIYNEERDESINDVYKIKLRTKTDFEVNVIPFKKKYETILVAIANQAAIAIENNLMIKQIRTQFEEFVKASVTAIESRDPATSGHSFRVARICRYLALAINGETTGLYSNFCFSETELQELEYSALLHDYGKVHIDTAIFSKAKKLFPKDFQHLLLKLEYLYRFIELKYIKEETTLKERFYLGKKRKIKDIKIKRDEYLQKIIKIKTIIGELNEPRIQDEDPESVITRLEKELTALDCTDIYGEKFVILTAYEKFNLAIKRGSLNLEERKEIESHVDRSYNFVSKIPWPKEFKRIPDFIMKHHEMLDGSGYPGHLTNKEKIPIQARMITIADIFDALIAADRPYKKALPLDQALFILKDEAQKNRIDKDLLDVFLKYKVYEKVSS